MSNRLLKRYFCVSQQLSYIFADYLQQIENQYINFQYSMKARQVQDLDPDDRRLLNVLQIKIYDISQNVQIFTNRLSNNQIKQVSSQTYSIFCQLKPIFQKTGVIFLYQILRKMQITSVLISSILTEKIDRAFDNEKNTIKQVRHIESQKIVAQSQISVQTSKAKDLSVKMPKLGGVTLYNQSYNRGLEYEEVDDISNIEVMGKCHVKLSKKCRSNLMESVARDLGNKTDVETDNINDQIKNFMRNYKQNNKISSCISYEKELSEIIDFFKTSQLQAVNYLSKSPKSGSQYTEDYVNRINDMEKQIKFRHSQQKSNILQKIQILIQKMKQKITQMEQAYASKNQILIQYQKSLIKQKTTISTQTSDGFEKKLKQLQAKVKETQEKYIILSQLKKDQFNMQDKIYEISHQLKIKTNQVKKLASLKEQQEEEIQYLKKIIRDNKQKLTVPLDIDHKKMKIKTKLFKEMSTSKKNLEEIRTFKILENAKEAQQQSDKNNQNQNDIKEVRHYKRTKRYQKLVNHTANGVRSSIQGSVTQALQKNKPEMTIQGHSKKLKPNRQDDYSKKIQIQLKNYDQQQQNQQSPIDFEAINSAQNSSYKSSQRQSKQNQQVYTQNSIKSRQLAINQHYLSQDLHQKSQKEESITNNVLKNNSINTAQESKQSVGPNKGIKLVQKDNQKQELIRQQIQKRQSKKIQNINNLCKFEIYKQYNIFLEFQSPIPLTTYKVKQKICCSERPYPKICFINELNPVNSQQKGKIKHAQNNLRVFKFDDPIQNLDNKIKDNLAINQISANQNHQYTTQSIAGRDYNKTQSILLTNQQIHSKIQMPVNFNTFIRKQQPLSLTQNQMTFSRQLSHSQQFSAFHNILESRAPSLFKSNEAISDKQSNLKESNQKIVSNNPSEDNITIINYIIEEIQRQHLNVQQFEQIIKIVQQDQQKNKQYDKNQLKNFKNFQPQFSNAFKRYRDEAKHSIQRDKDQTNNIRINNNSYKNIEEAFHSAKNTVQKNINQESQKSKLAYFSKPYYNKQKTQNILLQNQQNRFLSTQELINSHLSSNQKQHLQKIPAQIFQNADGKNKEIYQKIILRGHQYPLSKASMIKIKQLHCQMSKCYNNQSGICVHIQKYMIIIKKINDLSIKVKKTFKLPIQKIGQNKFQKDQIYESKQMIKKQTKNQAHKAGQCTIKYRLATEQRELLKSPILPIINNNNNFYKPKSKVVR